MPEHEVVKVVGDPGAAWVKVGGSALIAPSFSCGFDGPGGVVIVGVVEDPGGVALVEARGSSLIHVLTLSASRSHGASPKTLN